VCHSFHETRRVTRTAERLSLTQPSVSHSLRLREAFEAIDTTVSGVGQFDPATSRRTFRLHATDLGEVSLLPPETAPGVDVHIIPLNIAVVETELRQGQADAVICTHVAVDVSAGHTDVDRSLSLHGHSHDVALRIAHFAALHS